MNATKFMMDVSFSGSFRSSFLTRGISCFTSPPFIEYADANAFRGSSDKNVFPPGERAEIPR